MKITYLQLLASGGIADYALEQGKAFQQAGIEVDLVTVANFRHHSIFPSSKKVLIDSGLGGKGTRTGKIFTAQRLISRMRRAADEVDRMGNRFVLISCFLEYLSPFWSGRFKKLQQKGMKIASIIHDPVRDFHIGPRFWHQYCVKNAYCFLDIAFTHSTFPLDGVQGYGNLKIKLLPMGAFDMGNPIHGREEVRQNLNVPLESPLYIAFGHVRDNKNLDIFIRCMASNPEVYLLVAGKCVSTTQKPVAYYQRLADDLGVASRCRWFNHFLSDEEVCDLHAASDYTLLTYGANYHSASASFSVASRFRLPALASDGGGHMSETIKKYDLGVVIKPDSPEEMNQGIRLLKECRFKQDWDRYHTENSWSKNTETVVKTFCDIASATTGGRS